MLYLNGEQAINYKSKIMEKALYLSIIIPTYREHEFIGNNLLDIKNFLSGKDYSYEIILITDGSPDNTAEIARNYMSQLKNMRVIENPENRGKGYVVRQGFLEAKGKYVLFLDADGSTSITHLEKFLPEFENGYDVVVGSRKIEGAFIQIRQSRYREFMGGIANWLIRIVLGLWRFPDTQCGFKVLTNEAAHKIAEKMVVERFGFDFELLALSGLFGYKVKQVPVRWLNEDDSAVTLVGPNGFFQAFIDLLRVKIRLITGRYN